MRRAAGALWAPAVVSSFLFLYVFRPVREYDKLQQALRDTDTGFLSADDFIDQQIRKLLEQYAAWVKEREDYAER
jgi:hypothetical protein